MMKTTRQQIESMLEYSSNGLTPKDIAERVDDEDVDHKDVIDHVKHIKESRNVLVIPPECNGCGFDGFDHHLNHPSKCPNCRSTNAVITDPVLIIDC